VRRFSCGCGQRLFFEDSVCLSCGRSVGFSPALLDFMFVDGDIPGRVCRNRTDYSVCNWVVPPGDPEELCLACRLNRVIPNLAIGNNLVLWGRMEQAKRRMLYGTLRLKLPVAGIVDRPDLGFAFLEDQRDNPQVEEEFVMIGHRAGLITINLHEADDSRRHAVRESMQERYRTLLGHFRHEIGHYFWDLCAGRAMDEFRALFGDERSDYGAALTRYYEQGPQDHQDRRYISAYAAAHPMEDWAETWAHYMHILDGLETARENAIEPAPLGQAWDKQLAAWMEIALKINELNRSLGTPDPYPFVLGSAVQEKLAFIHRRVEAWRRASAAPAGA
jgi:hypothetical protein